MSNQTNIVLWSREGCSACQALKAELKEGNIIYKNLDVGEHPYLRDVLEIKYGIRHVPVVEIGKDQHYEAILDGDLNKILERKAIS
ncbi:glutaredoxin family protein [Alkalicoccobacillus porphyridii]|uniref:Glutaredoxin family protein n=1 Tax=Alkalicoccobacillus porphyridii TaxID=2597270 RepID=A0A554A2D1_9BACI|nr:glutaredoxin family protein [Alkalicoccobacillus porphyridii]TSB47851.1 glutaredoxin family protein [Alkalicoccobacillus porphyridii]